MCAVNCTVDGRSCCSHCSSHGSIAGYSSIIAICAYPTQPASTLPLGGGRRNIEIMFGMEKLEWWKILKICLFTSTESTNVTDGNHMTAYAALMHSIAWQWSVLKYLEAVIQSHKKRKRNRLQYSLFIQRVFDLLQLNHLQSADRSSASLNSDSVYYFWRCLNLHKLLHIVYYFASRILDVKNFPRRSRTTVKGRRRRLYTTLFFAINTVW